MTRQHLLFDAITQIRDDLIENAAHPRVSFRPRLKKGVVAAAVALAVGLSGVGLHFLNGGLSVIPGGASAGDAGHNAGSAFMSYAGPVFPLTALSGAEELTAERHVTYDFTPQGGRPAAGVQDDYVLYNRSGQDVTVSLAYPYASSFSELKRPRLSVDGQQAESALSSGPYSGGFTGARGGDEDGSINLDSISSWEGYKALLESGDYLRAALAEVPALDIPVTVYQLTGAVADHDSSVNPTLEISFVIDPERTSVVTYGFNGGSWNEDTGLTTRNFSVPRESEAEYDSPFTLLVIGEDLSSYTLKGYPDGGCEPGTEIDGITADVTRYESTLDDMLRTLTQDFDTRYGTPFEGEDEVPFELYFQEIRRLFAQYGPMGESPAERYTLGMLEDIISEAKHQQRVLYERLEVSIPAGGSVTVSAQSVKPASFDFAGAGSGNEGVYGFELAVQLGSSLTFEALQASITGYEGIEIVRQNFGFDLAAQIDTVALDPGQEYYYLEIRRTE